MKVYEIQKYNQLWVLTCKAEDGTISTVAMSASKPLIYNTKLKLENRDALEVCTGQ